MNEIFHVCVADQEGDVDWQIRASLEKAVVVARMMQETAFDKPKIHRVNLDTLEANEVDWKP